MLVQRALNAELMRARTPAPAPAFVTPGMSKLENHLCFQKEQVSIPTKRLTEHGNQGKQLSQFNPITSRLLPQSEKLFQFANLQLVSHLNGTGMRSKFLLSHPPGGSPWAQRVNLFNLRFHQPYHIEFKLFVYPCRHVCVQ